MKRVWAASVRRAQGPGGQALGTPAVLASVEKPLPRAHVGTGLPSTFHGGRSPLCMSTLCFKREYPGMHGGPRTSPGPGDPLKLRGAVGPPACEREVSAQRSGSRLPVCRPAMARALASVRPPGDSSGTVPGRAGAEAQSPPCPRPVRPPRMLRWSWGRWGGAGRRAAGSRFCVPGERLGRRWPSRPRVLPPCSTAPPPRPAVLSKSQDQPAAGRRAGGFGPGALATRTGFHGARKMCWKGCATAGQPAATCPSPARPAGGGQLDPKSGGSGPVRWSREGSGAWTVGGLSRHAAAFLQSPRGAVSRGRVIAVLRGRSLASPRPTAPRGCAEARHRVTRTPPSHFPRDSRPCC